MGWEFRLFSRASFVPLSASLQQLFPEYSDIGSRDANALFDARTDTYYVSQVPEARLRAEGGELASQSLRMPFGLHDRPHNPHGLKLRDGGEQELKILVEQKKRGAQKYKKFHCHSIASVPNLVEQHSSAEILDDVDRFVMPPSEEAGYERADIAKRVTKKELRFNDVFLKDTLFVVELSTLTIADTGEEWHTFDIEVASGEKKARSLYRAVSLIFGLPNDDWKLDALETHIFDTLGHKSDVVFVGGYPSWLGYLKAQARRKAGEEL
eukprot:TRINITY_DN92818_c0_g1_i1.p1 TRINITY_DN92818_c0_g1~~TRINITY_DN92818_c0_g1_i1.p1  ORF type:complete len:267 (+),score=30.03 TRINITY_DN92818_c0_g1_i1:198-998(+)